MPDKKLKLADLVLKLSTTAAAGLGVLFIRDAMISTPASRAELKAFNIRCSVGLARLLKVSTRARLVGVQIGVVLYHVQRIVLFHGLNSMTMLCVLADLTRIVLAGFRSISAKK